MPTYEHQCEDCKHEWEDIYKMSDPVPNECPECHTVGKVKRLISVTTGKVELYGHELKQHLVSEGRKMRREANKNENLAANVIGETKYHNSELARSKSK